MAIQTAMIDCTHKRFCFFVYTGEEAIREKTIIDKVFDNAGSINQFPIIWTWVKKKLLHRLDFYYNLINSPTVILNTYPPLNINPYRSGDIPPSQLPLPNVSYRLCEDVGNLWKLANDWRQQYEGKPYPNKLPPDWDSKLKRLEHSCKSIAKGKRIEVVSVGEA